MDDGLDAEAERLMEQTPVRQSKRSSANAARERTNQVSRQRKAAVPPPGSCKRAESEPEPLIGQRYMDPAIHTIVAQAGEPAGSETSSALETRLAELRVRSEEEGLPEALGANAIL